MCIFIQWKCFISNGSEESSFNLHLIFWQRCYVGFCLLSKTFTKQKISIDFKTIKCSFALCLENLNSTAHSQIFLDLYVHFVFCNFLFHNNSTNGKTPFLMEMVFIFDLGVFLFSLTNISFHCISVNHKKVYKYIHKMSVFQILSCSK